MERSPAPLVGRELSLGVLHSAVRRTADGRPCLLLVSVETGVEKTRLVKGSTGHLVGGSGAVEAVVALQTLRHGLVPPVAGLRVRDPAIAIDVVQDAPRSVRAGYALSNSFGFGGVNTCLVLAP